MFLLEIQIDDAGLSKALRDIKFSSDVLFQPGQTSQHKRYKSLIVASMDRARGHNNNVYFLPTVDPLIKLLYHASLPFYTVVYYHSRYHDSYQTSLFRG